MPEFIWPEIVPFKTHNSLFAEHHSNALAITCNNLAVNCNWVGAYDGLATHGEYIVAARSGIGAIIVDVEGQYWAVFNAAGDFSATPHCKRFYTLVAAVTELQSVVSMRAQVAIADLEKKLRAGEMV